MKKLGLLVTAMLLVVGMSSTAMALPYMPPLDGPLYIKFDNREQLSPTESIVVPGTDGKTEINWGIFAVSTIAFGDISTEPYEFDPVTPGIINTNLFSPSTYGGEITGIFYGVTLKEITDDGELLGQGGFIDFYWDDTPDGNLAAATPDQRTGEKTFTNFTDGDLLARLEFVFGADGDGSIVGDTVPTAAGFSGLAKSHGNVVDVNEDGVIDDDDGAWAAFLDTEYFLTNLGPNTADVRFRNTYSTLNAWNEGDPTQTGVFGAQSSDPARAYAVVPEPTTLLLLGVGLLGIGAIARKRYFGEKD